MEKHQLSLEVPKVVNPEIFTILDTSTYSTLLSLTCPEILITVPGFNSPSLIKVEKDFKINITACDLGLQTVNCGTERAELPDGVYIIRYSVAPNDQTYVEYNHLRTAKILALYNQVLCDIDVKTCEPHSERRDLIEEIQYIRTLIDAAVSKTEYCFSPSQGMDLYNFALKRLNKIICQTTGC